MIVSNKKNKMTMINKVFNKKISLLTVLKAKLTNMFITINLKRVKYQQKVKINNFLVKKMKNSKNRRQKISIIKAIKFKTMKLNITRWIKFNKDNKKHKRVSQSRKLKKNRRNQIRNQIRKLLVIIIKSNKISTTILLNKI